MINYKHITQVVLQIGLFDISILFNSFSTRLGQELRMINKRMLEFIKILNNYFVYSHGYKIKWHTQDPRSMCQSSRLVK